MLNSEYMLTQWFLYCAIGLYLSFGTAWAAQNCNTLFLIRGSKVETLSVTQEEVYHWLNSLGRAEERGTPYDFFKEYPRAEYQRILKEELVSWYDGVFPPKRIIPESSITYLEIAERSRINSTEGSMFRGMRLSPAELTTILQAGITTTRTDQDIWLSERAQVAVQHTLINPIAIFDPPQLRVVFEINVTGFALKKKYHSPTLDPSGPAFLMYSGNMAVHNAISSDRIKSLWILDLQAGRYIQYLPKDILPLL